MKGEREWSSGHLRRSSRLTLRAVGSDVWGVMEVNCLLKAVAMERWVEKIELLKVIGWLGVWVGRFPERDYMRDQKWEGWCLCEHASTVCIHFFRLESDMSCVMCWSRTRMWGCVGSVERSTSRSWISLLVESGRSGMGLGMWPWGMKCLAAVRRIRRNWDSPVLQEEGCSRRAKASSVSRVYESQSAFFRLR